MKKIVIQIILLLIFNYANAQEQITNNGNLKMHAGSSIAFFGDFANNGTFSNNSGDLYLSGTSMQTVSGTNLAQADNLHINNNNNVTVNLEFQISSLLTFTSGKVITDTANISTEFIHFLNGATYTGASNSKFVNGVVRKTGNQAFVFPVGYNNDIQNIGMSAPSDIADNFTAYYTHTDPNTLYNRNSITGCIDHVSKCEYWILNRTGGSSNVEVTLDFDANSCGITDLCELLVGRWDGSQWVSEGNGGTNGTTSAGTITSGDGCISCGTSQVVSSFNAFILASSTVNNPLSIELINFEVKCKNNIVSIFWSTASEFNNDYFTIEKSYDNTNWTIVDNVTGAGISNKIINYSYTDINSNEETIYYRIKQTDYNGEYMYSESMATKCNENSSVSKISFNPNPFDNIINLDFSNIQQSDINIDICTVLGNIIKKFDNVEFENNILTINLKDLPSGIYFIKVNFPYKSECFKVMKK